MIDCFGLEHRWGLIASRGSESHPNRQLWRGAGIGKQASLETMRVNSPRTVGTCPLRHLLYILCRVGENAKLIGFKPRRLVHAGWTPALGTNYSSGSVRQWQSGVPQKNADWGFDFLHSYHLWRSSPTRQRHSAQTATSVGPNPTFSTILCWCVATWQSRCP